MGKSRARMPAFYRQSIQNAVNQQINISKSKHRTMLNREAIGQVVSYCAVAAAHDLWDWDEKEIYASDPENEQCCIPVHSGS